jgi:hypothetical protein
VREILSLFRVAAMLLGSPEWAFRIVFAYSSSRSSFGLVLVLSPNSLGKYNSFLQDNTHGHDCVATASVQMCSCKLQHITQHQLSIDESPPVQDVQSPSDPQDGERKRSVRSANIRDTEQQQLR